jgi:hypothetical protein
VKLLQVVSCTEEYNGSAWSAGGALITVKSIIWRRIGVKIMPYSMEV